MADTNQYPDYDARFGGPLGAGNQQNKASSGQPQIGPDQRNSGVVNAVGIGPQAFKKEPEHKYNIGSHQYPLRLQGDPDLKHYVVFNINVRGSSKYKNQYGATTAVPTNNENRLKRSMMGQTVDDVVKVTATGGGAYAGIRAVAAAGGSPLGIAVAGIVGGAVGYAANEALDLFTPDQTFRIGDAIRLAITDRPNVKYGVDYVSQDMGILGNIMQGGGSLSDMGPMNSELARSILLNLAQVPAAAASVLGSNFDPAAAASVATGMTPNPFREQMFKSVDNRTFTFDYKFLPRSAAEAAEVEKIIYKFKFHMHPEISQGGYFYIYPSEFNIMYMYNGKENKHIHKISTCVLENMSVDYGSQGGFHAFGDGTPTEINLRLQFKELEVLTKERIEAGY